MTLILRVRAYSEPDLVHLKYMQMILSPTPKFSDLIVFYSTMGATLVGVLFLTAVSMADKFDEENYGVKVRYAHVEFREDNYPKMDFFQFADECEVCKIVSMEIDATLAETAGKSGVIETGYSVEKEKKKTKLAFPILI